ncbi:MAG TPA: phosphoesterase, partial [Mucilaginibacter sp.]|nr:phosphoesterase [Mucilaginibacter sp.]
MKYLNLVIAILFAGALASCGHKSGSLPADADILHANEDELTNVIIYDVFTPPVAARIYGYTNLASYEAMKYADPKYNSITAQLRGFDKMPEPEKGKSYNFTLAATKAFFTVAHKVTFSVDTLKRYEDHIYGLFKNALPDSTYANSMMLGENIGNTVLKRANIDDYPQTRGKPKYLGSNSPGKWRPTPPDYMDGVEFCWGDMHTLLVDSSIIFMPPPPPTYSDDTTSAYFKQLKM